METTDAEKGNEVGKKIFLKWQLSAGRKSSVGRASGARARGLENPIDRFVIIRGDWNPYIYQPVKLDITVGNGEQTTFWHERWLSGQASKDMG
jgi:hypothetical protein